MQSIETLNFSIGGFFGGYERIIWQDNKLHHQFFEQAYPEDEEVKPNKVLGVTIHLQQKIGKSSGKLLMH